MTAEIPGRRRAPEPRIPEPTPTGDGPEQTTAHYAVDLFSRVIRISPWQASAAQLGIIAHYARAEGVTEADFDLSGPLGGFPMVAIHAPLTPLAEAAMRLATEHPHIADTPARTRNALARQYLAAAELFPEQVPA